MRGRESGWELNRLISVRGGCSRWSWISDASEFLKLFVADPKYLACVDGWYEALAQQLTGLYHKDGGPIVMAQVPNHMLSNHQSSYLPTKQLPAFNSELVSLSTDNLLQTDSFVWPTKIHNEWCMNGWDLLRWTTRLLTGDICWPSRSTRSTVSH